jgi:ribonuclease BN (tRNA processing enzyme)
MKRLHFALSLTLCLAPSLASAQGIPDTGQDRCFGDREEIAWPKPGGAHFGQDAHYRGSKLRYRDNRDGSVSDLVTGLTWQKTPDFRKRTQSEAAAYAEGLRLAGKGDWRLPSIKELVSIVDFRGTMHTRRPYIDTKVFDFKFPQSKEGESGRVGQRNMDAQYCSSTVYVGKTMRGDASAFGFNFADGRVKSYPLRASRYVRCVRGRAWGECRPKDVGDGTVLDQASGLMWTRADAGKAMGWKEALAHARSDRTGGHKDWRLPNVKELQSIVDYSRAADATNASARGPAIARGFKLSTPKAWCWTSTTHIETGGAYYVCFGLATSALQYQNGPMNAHGAGAIRSDPKTGDPSRWSQGLGPQRDEVRIRNQVLLVRGGKVTLQSRDPQPGRKKTQVGPSGGARGQGGGARSQGGRRGQPGGAKGKRDTTSRFIRRLDRNGDGRVSPSEFDGPAHRFPTLDRNNDGYLDADEAPHLRGRGRQGGGEGGGDGGGSERGARPRRGASRAKGKSGLRHASAFSVITVGTGAPRYNKERAGPSALIHYRGAYVLVDVGLGSQARLSEAGLKLGSLSALAITHHHLDHNAEFVSTLVKARLKGGAKSVIGPPRTKDYVDFVMRFYEEDMDYRAARMRRSPDEARRVEVKELKGGEEFRVAGLRVKTARVNHTIHTLAYRFESDEASIVISGDLTYSESLIALAKGADVLVIDSGAVVPKDARRRRQGPNATRQRKTRAHASLEEVASMASKAGVKKLVLTHFGAEPDVEATRAKLQVGYGGEIVFGKDMLEVTP